MFIQQKSLFPSETSHHTNHTQGRFMVKSTVAFWSQESGSSRPHDPEQLIQISIGFLSIPFRIVRQSEKMRETTSGNNEFCLCQKSSCIHFFFFSDRHRESQNLIVFFCQLVANFSQMWSPLKTPLGTQDSLLFLALFLQGNTQHVPWRIWSILFENSVCQVAHQPTASSRCFCHDFPSWNSHIIQWFLPV